MQNGIFKIIAGIITLILTTKCFSQSVSINNNGASADTTAILDVNSSTKGMLIPRMTTQQKNTIINPSLGLLIYQTDGDNGFYYYNGVNWLLLVTTYDIDKQNTLIYTIKGF